jgi:dermatan/chondrotin sulfate uronyl 2-O-sulfotransferase UST
MKRRINIYIFFLVFAALIWMLELGNCPVGEVKPPWNPNNSIIILSNRVPKCGSHLTRTVFQRLSLETHAYASENSENHYECRLSVKKQNELRNELLQKAQNAHYHRFIYDRHFHFVEFIPEPGVVFYYINQLRDPIDQIVSGYYYNRYICMITSAKKTCTYYPPTIYNLTLDECISSENPTRCLTKTYGAPEYLIYFCGQSPICNDAIPGRISNAALSLAKANIERHYIYVGLLEYIKNSFEILEHLQPSIFSGIVRIYHQVKYDSRKTSTPEEYRRRPNNKTREILRELLVSEYELYEFVRERFFRQYSRIFHRLPSRFN